MKKLLAMLLALLLISPAAMAGPVAMITPEPAPSYDVTLIPSQEEVRVYAEPDMDAKIVGYIMTGGQQQVYVLGERNEWYYVGFTTTYGTSYGWIHTSFFHSGETPTAVPTATPAPEESFWCEASYVVNAGAGYRLNLRSSPAADASSMGKYYTGTPLLLTGRVSSSYAQVQIGTQTGWMDVRFLITRDEYRRPGITLQERLLSMDDPSVETPVVTVQSSSGGAAFRSEPSASASRLGWYDNGTEVLILGVRSDEWYHVVIGEQTGFMAASVLSANYPFQYGTDSDNPALNSSIGSNVGLMYVAGLKSGGQLALCAQASYSSKVLGRFYAGTPVSVVSYTRTGWAYVCIGQLEGYMDMSFLSTAIPHQTGKRCEIRNSHGTGMNLRALPTTAGELIGFYPNYTEVIVLGDVEDGWCYVQVGENSGYMLGSRLKEKKTP